MCGIYLGMSLTGKKIPVDIEEGLVKTSLLRGRDGGGIKHYPWGFVGSSRARPLPEGLDFVYPHIYKDYAIVFNGTLSNADLIADELGITIQVDTEVIGPCIEKYGLKGAAEKFVGGFAIIVAEKDKVSIIRNFKTLWYLHTKDFFLVASEKEFLDPYTTGRFLDPQPQSFPRDIILTIEEEGINKEFFTNTVWGGKELDDNKAIIVASGGLDSSVAAAVAKKIHGKEVLMLNFDYGQLSSKREWQAVQDVASSLGVACEQVPFTYLGGLGGSPLTDCSIPLPLGKISVESTLAWVPARNFAMLAMASAVAEARGIKWLYFGNNLEEESCLLDCEANVVRLADGRRVLPSQVQMGDSLLAWDEKEKQVTKTNVTQLYQYDHKKYLRIKLKGRSWKKSETEEYAEVLVSQKHPFFVKGKGWITSENLQVGDVFFRLLEATQVERWTGEGNFRFGKDRSGVNNPMTGKKRDFPEEHRLNISKGIRALGDAFGESIRIGMEKLLNDPIRAKSYFENKEKSMKKFFASEVWKEMKPLVVTKLKKKAKERCERLFIEFGVYHWNQLEENKKKLSVAMSKAIGEGRVNPSTNLPKPTQLEKNFEEKVLLAFSLPFRYVGDGQIWITCNGRHMNPDFINLENKWIIEVGAKFWHNQEEISKRIEDYSLLGWKCLYLLEEDLVDNEIAASRIMNFFNLGETIRNGLTIIAIEEVEEDHTVYNFHCEPHNNFFINTQGILTHNSGYVDNDLEFVVRMNSVLEYGTLRGVKVKRALARLMKIDIVALGTYLGVPFAHTWSCDMGLEIPCGKCGCCTTRRHTFVEVGIEDKQKYVYPLTDSYFSGQVTKPNIDQLLELVTE